MTRKVWYLIALSFPFIIPLTLLHRDMEAPSDMIGIIKLLLIFQLLYGGIQYLVFTAGVLIWSRNKTAYQIHNAAWKFPLLFVPVCEAGFFIAWLLGLNTGVRDHPMTVYWLFGLISPLYGYFYMGLIQGLTWVLEKTNIIKD